MSNFSFSNSIFSSFEELCCTIIRFEIVVCKLSVWKRLKFVVWERVNPLPNFFFLLVHIESINGRQNKCDRKIEVQNIVGKGENASFKKLLSQSLKVGIVWQRVKPDNVQNGIKQNLVSH